MKSAHFTKKALSLFLSLLMVLTLLPVMGFVFTPKAQAYGTYTKNYTTEYYYASGTTFIEALCVGYDSSSASTVRNQMTDAGWTPVSNFLDMMQSWSGTKNIYVGYKTTTNPANALTDIEFFDSDDAHSNYDWHGKNSGWANKNTGTDTCNGTSATGVKDKNTGIVFFRAGGSPMTAYSRDGIVDFLMGMGSGYGYEYLCATKNRSAGAAITAVDCFSGTSSGWTMATCLARGCTAHSSAHGHSTRYVGYQRLTTTVNSNTLRSNYTTALGRYNEANYAAKYTAASRTALQNALTTAEGILSDLNDGYTTSNQTAINNAATALSSAVSGLTLNTYTVTFKGYTSGTTVGTLKTQTVNWGADATAPTVARTSDANNHYTFSSWSGTYTNVTANQTVNATYTTAAHTYGDYVSNGNGQTATHKRTCTVCGYVQTATHTWNAGSVTTQPTCTGTGVKTFTCTAAGCGATYTASVSAKGHTPTEIAAKAATCLAAGNNKYYKCTTCNKYFTTSACTTETTVAAQTIAQLSHSYTGAIKNDGNGVNGTHSFKCVNGCNQYGGAVTHTWNGGSVTTQPTCTGTGVKTFTCTVSGCGATYTETVNAKGHTMQEIPAKAATCLAAGNNKYYKCTTCNKYYTTGDGTTETTVAAQTIAQKSHNYTGEVKNNENGTHSFKCVNGCNEYGGTVDCDYDTEVTPATCLEDGYTTYTCKVCGYTYTDDVTTKLGHTYTVYVAEVTPATCLANATATYKCERCAETTVKEVADTKLAHSYTGEVKNNENGTHSFKCVNGCNEYGGMVDCDYKTEVTPATCLEDGYTTYTCKVCGYTYTDDVTTKLGHTYTVYVAEVTPATCLANATATYKCERCAETTVKEVADTKLAHSYTGEVKNNENGTHSFKCVNGCNEYGGMVDCDYETEVTPATCLEYGYTTYTCKVCGYNYTGDETAKLGHDYTVYVAEVTPATCLANATATYKCERCAETTVKEVPDTKLDHSYTGEVKNNENGTHSFKCVNGCNEYGGTVDCDYDTEVTPATCLEDGYTTYTCKVCGYTYTDDVTTKLGHDYTVYVAEVTPATCLANATATYKCERCAETTVKEVADTKLDHSYTGEVKNNENGTHSFKCVNGCNEYGGTVDCDYDTEVTPATCLEDGYTTYTCKVCGYTYTDDVTTKLGHDYTVYVAEVTPATCLANATATYKCERCAETTVKEVADTKLDHSYTGEVKNNENGTHSFKCVNGCNEYGGTVDCDYKTEVTNPTCLDAGYTTHTCTVCGFCFKDTPVTALGHDFDDSIEENVTIENATCTEDGLKTVKCSRCDETEETVLTAPGHTPLEAVKENETAPTYEADGGYDLVVYCDVCGDEIERTHVVIPKLTDITAQDDPSGVSVTYRSDAFTDVAELVVIHVLENAEVESVNALLPAGFYKDTVYEIHMEVNGVETQPKNAVTVRVPVPEGYVPAEITVYHIADDNTVTPVEFTVAEGMLIFTTNSFSNYAICATHEPAEAVTENQVDASCTTPGSYDSVIYCALCGAELERESGIEIPAKGHTPGEVMTENIVPATCMAAGSYEEAVYCQICGEELSRNTVTVAVDPNAHVWGEWTVSTAGSCTEDSVEIRFCECNDKHFETRIVPAPGHDWGEWTTVTEATLEANGLDKRVCARCGEEETRETYWDAEATRRVQFVVSGSMHYVLHADGSDYSIYRDNTPAVLWYPNRPLTFSVVLHSTWKGGYIVSANGKELKANADGTYTLPAGSDFAIVNCDPIGATATGTDGETHSGTCPFCGKIHPSSFWGRIVALVHTIFYFFRNLFKK